VEIELPQYSKCFGRNQLKSEYANKGKKQFVRLNADIMQASAADAIHQSVLASSYMQPEPTPVMPQ
jgi:hypothetical protein